MSRVTWILSKLVERQERATFVDATSRVDDYENVLRRHDQIEQGIREVCRKNSKDECCKETD